MRADLFFESMLTPINSKMLSWEMPQLSLLIDCLFITGEIHDCKYKCSGRLTVPDHWMRFEMCRAEPCIFPLKGKVHIFLKALFH